MQVLDLAVLIFALKGRNRELFKAQVLKLSDPASVYYARLCVLTSSALKLVSEYQVHYFLMKSTTLQQLGVRAAALRRSCLAYVLKLKGMTMKRDKNLK